MREKTKVGLSVVGMGICIVAIALIICFVGCEEPAVIYNPPGAIGNTTTLDIPKAYRVKNYAGGSCGYAASCSLLHSQGKHALAKWVRANKSGATFPSDIKAVFDEAGLKYTYGEGIDFLRRCHNRRLYCVVGIEGSPYGHVVNFVGIDSQYVYLLDNNYIEEYSRVPIDTFRSQWSGWGIALVEKSLPPSLTKRGTHGT